MKENNNTFFKEIKWTINLLLDKILNARTKYEYNTAKLVEFRDYGSLYVSELPFYVRWLYSELQKSGTT